MSTNMPIPLTLAQHIKALPQELQDIISDFTITDDQPSTIILTPSYRPPLEFHQFSRKIRNKLARTYYSTTTFRVKLDLPVKDVGILMGRFLSSLPPEHLQLIPRIEFEDYVAIFSPHPQAAAAERFVYHLKRNLPPSFNGQVAEGTSLRMSYVDMSDGWKVKWIRGSFLSGSFQFEGD